VHAGGLRHRGRRRGVAPRRDPERARGQRRRPAPVPAGVLRRARRPSDPTLGEGGPPEEVVGPRRAAERRRGGGGGGAGEEGRRHG
jgi:hypothetical protein